MKCKFCQDINYKLCSLQKFFNCEAFENRYKGAVAISNTKSNQKATFICLSQIYQYVCDDQVLKNAINRQSPLPPKKDMQDFRGIMKKSFKYA